MTYSYGAGQPEVSMPSVDWLQRLLHYQPSLFAYISDLLHVVVTHTPRLIAARLLERPIQRSIALSLEGTVMFADLDGFTHLAERFSQLPENQGVEELTELTNRFMAILIQTTRSFGGDLLKFGGDAGMLYFEGEMHALRAVAAAVEVQQAMRAEMGEVTTSLGQFPLQVAIGLGSGRLIGLGLGDPQGREFLPLGPPLTAMGKAQMMAPPTGIVAHASTVEACGEGIDVTEMAPDFAQVMRIHQLPMRYTPVGLINPPRLPQAGLLTWYLSRLDAVAPYLAPGLLDLIASIPALDSRLLSSDRRLVTVMMVSMPALGNLMPLWGNEEALVAAMSETDAVFTGARDTIHRYDGLLNKIAIGPDGAYLMALFGAPNSHEDDPLRAVLAALELQEMTGQQVRVGINTGFVFAGDVGTSERREYTVMGDEVNLAARLMGACAPGEVWLGQHTARHPAIVHRIVTALRPPTRFKGKSEPLQPAVVQGVRQAHWSGAVPVQQAQLVGRASDLSRLVGLLNRVEDGELRLVLLHGSAGVGKSCLARAWVAQARARGCAVHLGEAPSYGEHLLYAGWDEILVSLMGLSPSMSEWSELTAASGAEAEERFVAALEDYGIAQWAALIAPLVGLNVTPSREVLTLPQTMRDMQRQSTILTLLEEAAREDPILLVFDNGQWLSEASLVLIDTLVAALSQVPLTICVVSREPSAVISRWHGVAGVVELPVGVLSTEAMHALVVQLVGDSALPEPVVDWVVSRGGGLPIFATEAMRALVDSGVLRRDNGAWKLAGALEDLDLPDMVYALIQSRIDQLSPPNRHLLRAAATVGNEMTLATLAAAYGEESESSVRRRLPHLAPFGLLPRDVDSRVLVFRQPLVRDVAYRGLPHRVQREIHERLTVYLDTNRKRAAPNWLTLVAYHAFEAHLWERAVWANLELGRQAAQSYLAEQAWQALNRVLEAADAGGLIVLDARFEAHSLLSDNLISMGLYEQAMQHLVAAREVAHGLMAASPQFDAASPQSDATSPQSDAETSPEPAFAPVRDRDVARFAHLDYREAMILEAQGRYGDALEVVKRGLARPGIDAAQGSGKCTAAQLYLVGADLLRRLRDYGQARVWAGRALALSAPTEGQDLAGLQHIRYRTMYMLALLASLERLQIHTEGA